MRRGSGSRTVRSGWTGPGGQRTPELMAAPQTQLSTGGIIAVNLATLVGRLLWWLARHPGIVMPLALLFVSVAVIGRELTGLILLGLVVAHLVWWWRWPRSFNRLVYE